jgi:hypothetical protein
MALELPFGIKTVNPTAVDFWSGPYSGVVPQEAINSANSGIAAGIRYVGQEVTLVVSGVSKKYWYESGVSDSNLVPFIAGSGGGNVSLVESNPSGIVFVNNDGQITTDQFLSYDSGRDQIYLGSGGIRFSDGSIQVTAAIDGGTYFTGPAYALWTGNGLIFDVIYPTYFLDGQQFPGGNDQISLPSGDSTYDRFDAIIVDSGGATSIQGVPEAAPVFPNVDSINQLLITYINIPTSGTTPGNIDEKIIYDENLEWVGSGNLTNLNFNNTTNPNFGLKHTSFTGFSSSSFLQYNDAGPPTLISSFSVLRFYIKLGAELQSNRYLRLTFYRSGLPVSNTVDLTNGNYNFSRNNTSYQLIAIPLSAFTFGSSDFDSLRFTFSGSTTTTIYLDNISLQTDIGAQPQPDFFRYIITDDGIIFADQPNDALRIINSNKTGTKEITIPGGSGSRVYSNVSSNTSMTSNDDLVFANSSSGPLNVYIPVATNAGGKEITIKMVAGIHPVTVIPSGSELIDGQASVVLRNTYESITLASNNSNWFII